MHRFSWPFVPGVLLGLLAGVSCTSSNESHCSYEADGSRGDAWCERERRKAFCSVCETTLDGCVDEEPSNDCHFASGGNDDESSEGTDTGSDAGTQTTSGTNEESTGEESGEETGSGSVSGSSETMSTSGESSTTSTSEDSSTTSTTGTDETSESATSSSEGSTDESESTGTTETGDTTGTTGEDPECMDDMGCEGKPGTPYCRNMECVSCVSFASGPTATDCTTEVGPDLPVCLPSSGSCVACTAEIFGSCEETQVCQSDNTCGPCTEHAQCASGGCELDTGECINTNIFYVDDSAGTCPGLGTEQDPDCTIGAARVRIPIGEKGVIHIAAGTYPENVPQTANRTMVLVGAGAAQVVVNGGGGDDVLNVSTATGKTYLSNLSLADTGSRAVLCSNQARVWLDDVEIHDADLGGLDITDCTVQLRRTQVYANAGGGFLVNGGTLTLDNVEVYDNEGGGLTQTNADTVVRRSRVYGNQGGGFIVDGGTLRLENSFVVDNGSGSNTDVGAFSLSGTADVDVVYTSVVLNQSGVAGASGTFDCSGGTPIIDVRNSILETTGAPVLQNTCLDVAITYSSTSDADVAMEGTNDLVAYDGGYFTSVVNSDLHLTPSGATAFQGECLREPGDPIDDIDGELRADEAEDYRGADVPL